MATIAVDFDGDSFCIRDNCGGIPLDVAQEYAFRFGRPKEKETGNKNKLKYRLII